MNTIDEIIKYGLNPGIDTEKDVYEKVKMLEKNLIKIYCMYFDIEYKFDETEYPDYEGPVPLEVSKNIYSNFNDFACYKVFLDILDTSNNYDYACGCASDDLADIIRELLEVKWRIENNSLADGLWHFEFSFNCHIKQHHMLDLLQFMKERYS